MELQFWDRFARGREFPLRNLHVHVWESRLSVSSRDALGLLVGVRVYLVLLQLAVESGFSDAQRARGSQFVAGRFLQSFENRAALHFLQRNSLVIGRESLRPGAVLHVRGQIAGVQNRA